MATRMSSRSTRLTAEETEALELEQLSDAELEQLLFGDEPGPTRRDSVWNLPTIAGLALLLVGSVYVLQQLGLWHGVDVSVLVGFLPWVAAALILLVGLGVLSWRPRRRPRPRKPRKSQKTLDHLFDHPRKVFEELRGTFAARSTTAGTTNQATTAASSTTPARRLVKSRDRRIAGVCGGIAEYFGWDPTLVRALFLLGAIFSSGFPFVIVYLILAWVMPDPESDEKSREEEPRITILPE